MLSDRNCETRPGSPLNPQRGKKPGEKNDSVLSV